MIRSLVVTTWFPDEAHPSRTPFCLAHVHALQSAGIDVEVVHVQLGVATPRAKGIYQGVPVIRMSMRATDPQSWFTTLRVVRRRLAAVDVLHTMAFSSVLVTALPWLLRRRPWVHTEHWNGVSNPKSVGGLWRMLAFLRQALRLPHAVTGVTQQLAEQMAHFARPGAARVVPCVVPQPPRMAQFPPPEPLRLIGVGLLNERKNPLLAVETIAWLRDQEVDVRYEWIGDGPLAPAARRLVDTLGLRDRVTFSGAVEPSKVQPMVEKAHIFFVPSSQENFFTALAEAIAVGRPAVAPRSGGFVEYCTPANSVLVDGWAVRDLGMGILDARDRFQDIPPTSVSATISQRFSQQRIGEQFLAVYEEIMAPRD